MVDDASRYIYFVECFKILGCTMKYLKDLEMSKLTILLGDIMNLNDENRIIYENNHRVYQFIHITYRLN